MELKKYIESLKLEKGKDNIHNLSLNILKLEEIIVESATHEKLVQGVGDLLEASFLFVKENKIEVNNEVQDLDLDYWKNNISIYKSKNPSMSKDVYLYSIRNSLRYLLEHKKDKILLKAYIFEIIIKTFLFIDYLNLSINSILEARVN
jgi:hypothetical protein